MPQNIFLSLWSSKVHISLILLKYMLSINLKVCTFDKFLFNCMYRVVFFFFHDINRIYVSLLQIWPLEKLIYKKKKSNWLHFTNSIWWSKISVLASIISLCWLLPLLNYFNLINIGYLLFIYFPLIFLQLRKETTSNLHAQ